MAKRAARVHRIVIERAVESLDQDREPIPTWTVVAVVGAAVLPLSGQELYSARLTHADVDYRIEVAYWRGITAKMRARWEGRIFDFRSVIDVDSRHRDLDIFATERLVNA